MNLAIPGLAPKFLFAISCLMGPDPCAMGSWDTVWKPTSIVVNTMAACIRPVMSSGSDLWSSVLSFCKRNDTDRW